MSFHAHNLMAFKRKHKASLLYLPLALPYLYPFLFLSLSSPCALHPLLKKHLQQRQGLPWQELLWQDWQEHSLSL